VRQLSTLVVLFGLVGLALVLCWYPRGRRDLKLLGLADHAEEAAVGRLLSHRKAPDTALDIRHTGEAQTAEGYVALLEEDEAEEGNAPAEVPTAAAAPTAVAVPTAAAVAARVGRALDKAEATNIRTEALKSAEAAVVEAFAMADAAEEAEQDLASVKQEVAEVFQSATWRDQTKLMQMVSRKAAAAATARAAAEAEVTAAVEAAAAAEAAAEAAAAAKEAAALEAGAAEMIRRDLEAAHIKIGQREKSVGQSTSIAKRIEGMQPVSSYRSIADSSYRLARCAPCKEGRSRTASSKKTAPKTLPSKATSPSETATERSPRSAAAFLERLEAEKLVAAERSAEVLERMAAERRATEAREALSGPLPHPMVDALKERVASAEEWAAFVQHAITWDAIEDSRERRPQLRASKAMAYAAIERALRRWGVSQAYCDALAAGQTASTLFHTVQACADASQSPSALAIMPSPRSPVRGLTIRSHQDAPGGSPPIRSHQDAPSGSPPIRSPQDAPGGSPPIRSHQDAPGGSPALARNSRTGVRQELRIRSGGELPPDTEAGLGGLMRPEAGMRGQMRPALAAKFLLGLARITWEGRLPAGCLGELCHALVAAWVRITLACCAQRLYIVVEAYDATKAHANLLLFASERDASAAASAAALCVTSTPTPLQRILRLPAEDVQLLCDVWAPPKATARQIPAPHALDRALQLSQEPVLHERALRTCLHNDRGHLAAEAPMGRRAVKTLPHQRSVTPCSCSSPDWRWKESLGGGSCAGI